MVENVSASKEENSWHKVGRRAKDSAVLTSTPEVNRVEASRPKLQLNRSIREYLQINQIGDDSQQWKSQRDIPTSKEISNVPIVHLQPNNVSGPWESKEKYLEAHYELFREDAVAPIRGAVMEIMANPAIMENESTEHAGIYEKVYITGITLAPQGIAARIIFSLRRAGKKVRWEQSKRLTSGSIVALLPADDMIRGTCKVVVVAARPLAGLLQTPPTIDIYFAAPDEIEIDPQQEWVMVEARQGFYEAYRHTLQALQKISHERFPLAEHLIDMDKKVAAPKYVEDQPYRNLLPALNITNKEFMNIDVLHDWPDNAASDLDSSQVEALRRILTKRLAIIQGPPGTGKTHVSVIALKTLLANMSKDDPPIVVAAQTNHALDQLLRHVRSFEGEFIRLGGRTVDREFIKPRTLYEVRQSSSQPAIVGGARGPALKSRKPIVDALTAILEPLTRGTGPLSAQDFRQLGLITQKQCESIEVGATGWVRETPSEGLDAMESWLGQNLVRAERQVLSEDYGFEYEEVDQEFEQLQEIEAENAAMDEDDFETLRGEWIPLIESFTGRKVAGVNDDKVKGFLKEHEMWCIPDIYRGAVYAYLQRKAKEVLRDAFCETSTRYMKMAVELKIGRWEIDSAYLQKARVVGMTTTGLSKYRGLVAGLKPRVVLIEEAAETLEAHITAACFDTLEHLILVGDHQQLRGHCAVPELASEKYNLDVSMFERLIKNNVEFSCLLKQRRMVPEISRIIGPIYRDLEDHPSVLDREPVPGMGEINSFFFSHQWLESTDAALSKNNRGEADMITGFFDYLVLNGTDINNITVLTFYNGQRKTILSALRAHRNLQGVIFKVVTVDSYQGEENEIVLLSLVRNNRHGEIGFLSIDNRVCVALSRARRGFYIFGQANLLHTASLRTTSQLWDKILTVMGKNPCRIGTILPLTCKNHGRITKVTGPTDWTRINGGCEHPCEDLLECGHRCKLTCHPFGHTLVNCQSPCKRKLLCGHRCREACYVQPCQCAISCNGRQRRIVSTTNREFPLLPLPSHRRPPSRSPPNIQRQGPIHRFTHRPFRQPHQRSPYHSSNQSSYTSPNNSPQRWSQHGIYDGPGERQTYQDFAEGGHKLSDARLTAIAVEVAVRERQRAADEEMANALFGMDFGTNGGTQNGSGSGSHALSIDVNNFNRTIRREIFNHNGAEVERMVTPEISLLDCTESDFNLITVGIGDNMTKTVSMETNTGGFDNVARPEPDLLDFVDSTGNTLTIEDNGHSRTISQTMRGLSGLTSTNSTVETASEKSINYGTGRLSGGESPQLSLLDLPPSDSDLMAMTDVTVGERILNMTEINSDRDGEAKNLAGLDLTLLNDIDRETDLLILDDAGAVNGNAGSGIFKGGDEDERVTEKQRMCLLD